jgi:hypothetical protein
MSNSPLVSYTKISPHRRSRNGNKISKITIHHCATVNASLEAIGNAFSGSRVASSNYCIDSNGKIAMYVEEEDRAITSSSTANDSVAVTIEVMNCKGAPNWEVSDAAYEALIDLCVDICKRNGIEELNGFSCKAFRGIYGYIKNKTIELIKNKVSLDTLNPIAKKIITDAMLTNPKFISGIING